MYFIKIRNYLYLYVIWNVNTLKKKIKNRKTLYIKY